MKYLKILLIPLLIASIFLGDLAAQTRTTRGSRVIQTWRRIQSVVTFDSLAGSHF